MLAVGHYRVRHFFGTMAYNSVVCPATVSGTPATRSYSVQILEQTVDFVELQITDSTGALVSSGFNFILVPIRNA